MPAKKKTIEVVDLADSVNTADTTSAQATTTTKPTSKRKSTKKATETQPLDSKAKVTGIEATAARSNLESVAAKDNPTTLTKDEIATDMLNSALEPLVTNSDSDSDAEEPSSNDKESINDSFNDKESINNTLSDSDSDNDSEPKKKKSKKASGSAEGREQKERINIQDAFYKRVMQDKVQVTVHLSKIKATGEIKHYDQFYILLESNGQEQFIYKQSIGFISAPKKFKRPFVRRDKPFYNTSEHTNTKITNQVTDQATVIASQLTQSDINAKENTCSQVQASTDKVENRPAKAYSSGSTSTLQIIKPDTDKSKSSSNEFIVQKPQSQPSSQLQKLEQKQSTEQVGSRPSIYSKADNNEQNQADKSEPNKTVKVFRIQSKPVTKPKK
jgi:host factor-I protein